MRALQIREVDEQQSTVAHTDDPQKRTSIGRGWLMFRCAFGVADLTQERVGAVLAACAAAAAPVPFEPRPDARIDVRHAALGILSDAVSGAARARASFRTRWSQVAVEARRSASPLYGAVRLVRRLPGVPRATTRLQAWRDEKKRQLAHWTELGRRERAESHVLAFNALTVLRENMIARVSDSPDVKRVIREESEGIAVTAVGELRDGSVRADNLAEEAVGRLFGRRRARRTP
jgi:hypothetical protein